MLARTHHPSPFSKLMDTTTLIDLGQIAHQLKLPLAGVQSVSELLDEGNTVPFITRYRKDQTGGLDERQIRAIQDCVNRERMLIDRRDTIRKSIESRDQLTPELAERIQQATSLRELDDIYLPYKTRKQTLAAIARGHGLGPLAHEVLQGDPATADLQQRAEEFVDAERLPSTGHVLQSLGHIIAEYYGDHVQLRSHLRRLLWREGRLVSKRIDEPPPTEETDETNTDEHGENRTANRDSAETAAEAPSEEPIAAESAAEVKTVETGVMDPGTTTQPEPAQPEPTQPEPTQPDATEVGGAEPSTAELPVAAGGDQPDAGESTNDGRTEDSGTPDDKKLADDAPQPAVPTAMPAVLASKRTESGSASNAQASTPAKPTRRDERREARRRRRERLVQSLKDYFDYSDPLSRVPHHRILAINRGDRTKVLRIKIEVPNWEKARADAEELVIPPDHIHASFLRGCLQDALTRLILPSLEREIRRELADRAEDHAVEVFARNLRQLLLQPPLRDRRVIAIDPGFRSGCKLVALDEFGKVLGDAFIHLVGSEERRRTGRTGLADFIRQHQAAVIAIGNGTACRETETLVAEVLSDELKDADVSYLIVNEAGASVYSTSDISREELPDYDATVRGAVSIGRRALDPLSELVKIDPASIGVGLYQHDVKAKHLRESLDAVVESCVNYVGVDVNSASPALLRYVSGLNALTARRIYEHRQQHGPFRNREQFKQVAGIGESTFVQAAGFLKITGGDNPLDGTWIHPESYETAQRVLNAIGSDVADLRSFNSKPGGVQATTDEKAGEECAAEAAPSPEAPSPEAPSPEAPSPEAPSPEAPSPEAPSPEAPDGSGLPDDGGAPEEPASSESASLGPSETATETVTTETPDALGAEHEEPGTERPAREPNSQDQLNDSQPTLPGSPGATAATAQLVKQLNDADVELLGRDLNVGQLLLQDIISALARPGRDPREDLPPPAFRRGILKLDNLKPGMELSGTVLNVVDFGAFVDIGIVDSGLIHVSRLADRFVADPHEVVSVGDVLRVWVVQVDQKRRRVSLTAIEPGTERARPERRKKPSPDKQEPSPKPVHEKKPRRSPRGKRPTDRGGRVTPRPKPKPKPVAPITKAMEEGQEPMRAFSDLKQFFEKKKVNKPAGGESASQDNESSS